MNNGDAPGVNAVLMLFGMGIMAAAMIVYAAVWVAGGIALVVGSCVVAAVRVVRGRAIDEPR